MSNIQNYDNNFQVDHRRFHRRTTAKIFGDRDPVVDSTLHKDEFTNMSRAKECIHGAFATSSLLCKNEQNKSNNKNSSQDNAEDKPKKLYAPNHSQQCYRLVAIENSKRNAINSLSKRRNNRYNVNWRDKRNTEVKSQTDMKKNISLQYFIQSSASALVEKSRDMEHRCRGEINSNLIKLSAGDGRYPGVRGEARIEEIKRNNLAHKATEKWPDIVSLYEDEYLNDYIYTKPLRHRKMKRFIAENIDTPRVKSKRDKNKLSAAKNECCNVFVDKKDTMHKCYNITRRKYECPKIRTKHPNVTTSVCKFQELELNKTAITNKVGAVRIITPSDKCKTDRSRLCTKYKKPDVGRTDTVKSPQIENASKDLSVEKNPINFRYINGQDALLYFVKTLFYRNAKDRQVKSSCRSATGKYKQNQQQYTKTNYGPKYDKNNNGLFSKYSSEHIIPEVIDQRICNKSVRFRDITCNCANSKKPDTCDNATCRGPWCMDESNTSLSNTISKIIHNYLHKYSQKQKNKKCSSPEVTDEGISVKVIGATNLKDKTFNSKQLKFCNNDTCKEPWCKVKTNASSGEIKKNFKYYCHKYTPKLKATFNLDSCKRDNVKTRPCRQANENNTKFKSAQNASVKKPQVCTDTTCEFRADKNALYDKLLGDILYEQVGKVSNNAHKKSSHINSEDAQLVKEIRGVDKKIVGDKYMKPDSEAGVATQQDSYYIREKIKNVNGTNNTPTTAVFNIYKDFITQRKTQLRDEPEKAKKGIFFAVIPPTSDEERRKKQMLLEKTRVGDEAAVKMSNKKFFNKTDSTLESNKTHNSMTISNVCKDAMNRIKNQLREEAERDKNLSGKADSDKKRRKKERLLQKTRKADEAAAKRLQEKKVNDEPVPPTFIKMDNSLTILDVCKYLTVKMKNQLRQEADKDKNIVRKTTCDKEKLLKKTKKARMTVVKKFRNKCVKKTQNKPESIKIDFMTQMKNQLRQEADRETNLAGQATYYDVSNLNICKDFMTRMKNQLKQEAGRETNLAGKATSDDVLKIHKDLMTRSKNQLREEPEKAKKRGGVEEGLYFAIKATFDKESRKKETLLGRMRKAGKVPAKESQKNNVNETDRLDSVNVCINLINSMKKQLKEEATQKKMLLRKTNCDEGKRQRVLKMSKKAALAAAQNSLTKKKKSSKPIWLTDRGGGDKKLNRSQKLQQADELKKPGSSSCCNCNKKNTRSINMHHKYACRAAQKELKKKKKKTPQQTWLVDHGRGDKKLNGGRKFQQAEKLKKTGLHLYFSGSRLCCYSNKKITRSLNMKPVGEAGETIKPGFHIEDNKTKIINEASKTPDTSITSFICNRINMLLSSSTTKICKHCQIMKAKKKEILARKAIRAKINIKKKMLLKNKRNADIAARKEAKTKAKRRKNQIKSFAAAKYMKKKKRIKLAKAKASRLAHERKRKIIRAADQLRVKQDAHSRKILMLKHDKETAKRQNIRSEQIAFLNRLNKGKENMNESNCCVVFCSEIFKLVLGSIAGILGSIFTCIFKPMTSFRYLMARAFDPRGTYERIRNWGIGHTEMFKIKMENAISGSEKITMLDDTIRESSLFQAFADKGKTNKERRRIEKVTKTRRKRIAERDLQALLGCRHNFLTTLRRRPCMWVYFLCPNMYPQCLSLLIFWRKFANLILLCLAMIVWTPGILLCLLCRSILCCVFCNG